MKKSFHIATISPFHKNIRKELTKMPKVYFYDMGLRNYFLNNFEGFDMRIDKGSLFENAVYRRLVDTYPTHAIKFWRTQNKNEIDFILEDHKKAYEVKIHTKNFIASKYKLFQQHYPDFDLQVIGGDNVFLI